MECNKGDAQRSKAIAEKKLMERDIAGAKKFAVKAQNLYPELDGLSQFVATLDVYISAERGVNTEVDWYRVLNVAPSADDETIRKNYRKLALLIHPDKNRSVGAAGAFRILSEAWLVLSDKARRSSFDQKRNLNVLDRKFPSDVSVPAGKGSDNFSKHKHSDAQTNKNSMGSKPPQHQPSSKGNTFWTVCNTCETEFEYLKVYRFAKFFCENCQEYFSGIEVPSLNINGNSSPTMPFPMRQQTPVQKKTKGRHYETKTTARTGSVSGSDVRGDVPEKKINEHRMHDITKETVSQMKHGNVGGSANVFPKTSSESGSMNVREVVSIRDALFNKAKSSISEMVKKWNDKIAASKNLEKGMTDEELTMQKGDVKSRDANSKNCEGLEDGKNKVESKKSSPANLDDDVADNSEINIRPMDVPDADFHNFDESRAEKSFGRNQVWAAYDDDDGMPRFYAMIHDVISMKPFKMKISWLNSKSNHELSPMRWIESGFYKTSGEFWIGKHVINKSLNSFSHKVNWTKGARGSIHIYPKKGDVWAIYRNWSPNWNELTPDELVHKYDMVEILEDYNKDKGVTIAFLVKVAGFKAVFRQQSDPNKTMTITREEMFRLSHQIPFHLLTGEEGNNVPKGCLELDPASLPLELLQVLSETQVEELKNGTENAKDNDQPNNAESAKEQELAGNGKTSKSKTEADNASKTDAKKVKKNENNDNKEPNYIVYKRRTQKKQKTS